jgi:hypothetical protein
MAPNALGHPRSPRAEGQNTGKNPDVPIRPQSRARRTLPGGRAHSGDLRILAAGGKESARQVGPLGLTALHVELRQDGAEVRSRGPDGGIWQSEKFGEFGHFGGRFRAHASGNSVRPARPPALPFLPARRFTARPDAAIGERAAPPSTNEADSWPARQDLLELIC